MTPAGIRLPISVVMGDLAADLSRLDATDPTTIIEILGRAILAGQALGTPEGKAFARFAYEIGENVSKLMAHINDRIELA